MHQSFDVLPKTCREMLVFVISETDVLIQPLHPAHGDVRVELVETWVVVLIKLHAIKEVSL